MGLQEKKAIQGIKDQYMGDLQKELNDIVGKELPIEMDWDSFSKDIDAIKFIPGVAVKRSIDAFREVCNDDMGKEAVQESINQLAITNIEQENAEANKTMEVKDGVFTIKASFGGHYSGFFNDTQIKDYLMNIL
ncbi:hypothetical protein [Flexithrix dorotheae]|uniref:hypothetical protein n=1 Tax=Flexithrix dorotheae TaxID=70993 RepID=UPI00036F3BDC|nr:hypothetical protein [Flexithrix dorotheae]